MFRGPKVCFLIDLQIADLYCVRDLNIHLDGFDLSACPLIKRKELLRSILPRDNTGRIRFTDHITGSGERLFESLKALKLEGMVMKRKDSVYAFMRCRDWVDSSNVCVAGDNSETHRELELD